MTLIAIGICYFSWDPIVFDNIALGIAPLVTEHRGARGMTGRALRQHRQSLTIILLSLNNHNIMVTQLQTDRLLADEVLTSERVWARPPGPDCKGVGGFLIFTQPLEHLAFSAALHHTFSKRRLVVNFILLKLAWLVAGLLRVSRSKLPIQLSRSDS